ncbi:two-component sensor histidine kinase [Selenomonas sp. oral taxon 126]|uniref:cache domain-containing sensor histidine kinase n=1 Tax=Selenomonas sp. oral taxon 126 TaxID=712528 RepID=UPI000807740B|nr:sensor histidine kinase [Selenomonas sp. oral taxon 126]ANR71789.1 two-component sensor histidine kinase [Selenomonas sp. oral taxon 126]
MGRYRISYQQRLLAYLLFGGLVPLLLASMMILYTADSVYENTQAKSGRAEVQRISREIDNLVVNYQRLMNPLLVRRESIAFLRGERADVEHIYGDLYTILAGRSGEMAIYLLSADGTQVIATDDLPRDYRLPEHLHWGLIGRATEQQDWVIASADRYEADRRETVFSMARAIRQGDELLGFAVIDVRREALVPLIQRVQDGSEGQIILTDRYNYVMMDMLDHHREGFSSVLSGSEEGASESVFRDYSYSSQDTGFTVHLRQRLDSTPLDYLFRLVLMVDAVALSITAYLAYRLSRHLWRPLHTLAMAMRRVRSRDDFSVQVDVQRSDEIGELALTFNNLVTHIRTLLAENRERERTLRVAQVKSLTEMIKPHFMYNTLNLIKWSAKLGDSEGAADIAVQLGKLLRASVSMKEFVTVAEELTFLRTYLKIQQRRFEGRLKVTVRVASSAYGCYVPKLILQPLVENAIQHGIEMTEGGGRIEITGAMEDNYLIFRVKDNGQGMSLERRQEVLARRDDNHFGLYNVHMRAVLNGDETCGIELHSMEGKGTEVILTLRHWEEAPHYD